MTIGGQMYFTIYIGLDYKCNITEKGCEVTIKKDNVKTSAKFS